MSLLNFPWGAKPSERTDEETKTNVEFWAGEDSELAVILTELAKSGKIITEDVVVDCQLTQFPPYGSKSNTPRTEKWEEEEDEPVSSSADPSQSNSTWWLFPTKSTLEPEQSTIKENTEEEAPKKQDLIDWDADEQLLWKKSKKSKPTTCTEKSSLSNEPTSLKDARTRNDMKLTSNANIDDPKSIKPLTLATFDDKSYWMPDVLCKNCYSCETPFTVFRRRHHCRLCGQVFCNTCCCYFVNNMRVCRFCFDQWNQNNQNQTQTSAIVTQGALSNTTVNEKIQEDQSTLVTTANTAVCSIPNSPARNAAESTMFSVSVNPVNSSLSAASPINCQVQEGHEHLGRMAAQQLELVARDLLQHHAPILCTQGPDETQEQYERRISLWINKLLTLATRCCWTVDPNVKKGDLLDIRPYVKVKTIPGGSVGDCAYVSGVMFRKTVSHKRMAREVENPRILILSGGIEFTRADHRIASLEVLYEQESKYMEILVSRILKIHPHLLLVGKSVSRKAQELLIKAGIILIQHVKVSLLSRIARQTGASILPSTEHILMNHHPFGENVLGRCRRFRLVTFRDNEAWTDSPSHSLSPDAQTRSPRIIEDLLADSQLSNSERQAALAAQKLAEDALDGCEAVKAGLSKRGVTNTYVMLEGCPKHLGCTIVLRGAKRAAIKQAKTVFKFLANVAYNLRLETTFLKERGARLRPDFQVLPVHKWSSSLCVDYGSPPGGRKVRPWNGGSSTVDMTSVSRPGELTAFDHQAILITSVWMTDKSQCCPAEVKGICYYSLQDVALGQFLRDSCFNLSLRCQNPNCKKSVLDHSLSFVHNDGLINIVVEEMTEPLPRSPLEQTKDDEEDVTSTDEDEDMDKPIATWTFCQLCNKVVTPLRFISEHTWKFSFGKFLEVQFYNRDAILNAPGQGCCCNVQAASRLYFGCGKLAARFTYERVSPMGVFVRKTLPLDIAFHKAESINRLEIISVASSKLFVNFDKHIEKVSREARSLFTTATNRPENLQTVLSELNRIGSEVDHAAKTLQEKIASVSDSIRRSDDSTINSALFRFPAFARRYLFNLTNSWNEKLSAAGQAISAMKKIAALASNRGDVGPNVAANVNDPNNDELAEGMKRLRQLMDHYARYNVTDITQVLPAVPESTEIVQDGEYDEEFDDPDASIDFPEGDIDADVLASRRRLQSIKQSGSPFERNKPSEQKPTKALGTRRSLTDIPRLSPEASVPKPTPGGAVKSAITRFFNRGGRDYDQYVVNLGIFAEGRPRLSPGVNGVVVPVIDDQFSTIIAFSLASTEYSRQFRHFMKTDITGTTSQGPGATERSRKSDSGKVDLDAGVGGEGSIAMQKPHLGSGGTDGKEIERQLLDRNKSHIKHTFRDVDEKGQVACKFVCTSYWAVQFHAVRQSFLASEDSSRSGEDIEQSFIESLSSAYSWAASGGKSGASFARTSDDRFVIKCISRTELQMFLDCAPAYFEYLSKAFFHGLPTVLCKIVGVYQIGVHNRQTGKRTMEQVAVMQNIFCNKKITKVFDLKGSLRGRYAAQVQSEKDSTLPLPDGSEKSGVPLKKPPTTGSCTDPPSRRSSMSSFGDDSKESASYGTDGKGSQVLLDGDFLEFTGGRPMPLTDRAKAVFQMSILNDTLFLSIINVLDYSILVGVDEDTNELVVGIIDFMRQYDILKQMERVGKSLPMVVGSEAPTIIQPPLYKARFTNAMERYFMTVPSKWTTI